MKTIAFALLTVALAAPAIAGDTQDAAKPKKPHLICKRDDTTGSRMSKNVCKTAAEWAGTTSVSDGQKLGSMTHSNGGGSGIPSLSTN